MCQDSQVQQHAPAEFGWEPNVQDGRIGVIANHGVVTLSGYVDSHAQKHAAKTATRRLKGVAGVAEEIETTARSQHKQPGRRLARSMSRTTSP